MIYTLFATGISAITLGIAYSWLCEIGTSRLTIERKIETKDGKIRIERSKPGAQYWIFYLGRLLFFGLSVYTLLLFTVINLVSFLVIFLLFFIGRTLLRFLTAR